MEKLHPIAKNKIKILMKIIYIIHGNIKEQLTTAKVVITQAVV